MTGICLCSGLLFNRRFSVILTVIDYLVLSIPVMRIINLISCFLFLIVLPALAQQQEVQISADLKQATGSFKPAWAYFGYDEPNYTYMKDGRKLLSELAALSPAPVFVRAHNLLTTGNGEAALKWGSTNAYTEDGNGNPVYNWKIVDSIFDTYVQRGMKPLAQIGFMPEALSVKPQPYRHYWKPGEPYEKIYTGWAYPPKDYKKWETLVYEWVKHCVERYGEAEVKSWWWEVWNEPNIAYWKGTPEEYHRLYDHAVQAVKRACPGARVGGCDVTGPGWEKAAGFFEKFLEHCTTGRNYASGQQGAPLDFISFHAKGSPRVMNGYVRMNMTPQLKDVATAFEIVSRFPSLKQLPLIIGECDPEGCAACSMATDPQNAYRNGTLYSSYTAASFARIYDLAALYGVNLEGIVSWSFEFEDQPWFAGFRDLATNGVDKPVLNVFRMYGMMRGERVHVRNSAAIPLDSIRAVGVRGVQPDVHALATAAQQGAAVMLWHYHDDDLPAPAASVSLELKNIPAAAVKVTHYRIDSTHSNAYTVWKAMGSPQQPTAEQYAALEKSGRLQQLEATTQQEIKNGILKMQFTLPRQGVSLVKVEW
jgi:xylan 1,4-beta-xylosidase